MPFTPFGLASPGGAAGGGLTGTYPNPGLASSAVLASEPWVWLPSDNGLLAASGDVGCFSSTVILVAGTLYLARMNIRAATTITNLSYVITAAGVGASTGSFVGLYNSAGTLLSGSADNGASLLGSGAVTTALTTPQAVAAGSFVWGAVLVNLATTQPTVSRTGVSSATGNLGLTAASFRWATNGTGLATLPASITPASNTSTPIAMLIAAT